MSNGELSKDEVTEVVTMRDKERGYRN